MLETRILPCIPLRGLTVYPRTILHFDIGRDKSIKALQAAMEEDKFVFLTSQKDESILIPTINDYYEIGTVCKVKQMLKVKGDAIRVLVDGQYRAKINKVIKEEPFITVETTEIEVIPCDNTDLQIEALRRIVVDSFITYVSHIDELNIDAAELCSKIEDLDTLTDTIAMQLDITIAEKQKFLEENDVKKRLEYLNEVLVKENLILDYEDELDSKVNDKIKKNQREFYLREQIKTIEEELGYGEEQVSEVNRFNDKLESLKLNDKVRKKVKDEIRKYQKMQPNSPDASISREYIETILDMPWNDQSKVNQDLKKAEKILNEEHFGLEKVKERILEYLAVIHLSNQIKGPILCLVGPPGVGKTSIAKSIAHATGREFVRMSLGGVKDEAEIRGHRRTYIGAIPGRIISLIKECKKNNPVFLFDEVDKIGQDFRGDPASALLEVLDPEQNKEFTDHYLDVPFDLSNVLFVTTANSIDTIPRPLLDRMELIELSGYTEDEKVKIANNFLIPKQIKQNGLKNRNFSITEKALRDVINYYTRESGVRNLERVIGSLTRKVARKIVLKKGTQFKITPLSLEGYLGKKRYHYDTVTGKSEVGNVTGMAWTEVGGDTLYIETQIVPGSGQIQLTGQLGDVMQESAKAAITYIRSISKEYTLIDEWYKKFDIHVHVPEGAVPKDGPSAGVTMFTSILSSLTNNPVRSDIAMTGEITLRGKILPVGGIKEKVLAAYRAGIGTILLPKDNKADIDDIPSNIRKDIDFILLENAKDALNYAFANGGK